MTNEMQNFDANALWQGLRNGGNMRDILTTAMPFIAQYLPADMQLPAFPALPNLPENWPASLTTPSMPTMPDFRMPSMPPFQMPTFPTGTGSSSSSSSSSASGSSNGLPMSAEDVMAKINQASEQVGQVAGQFPGNLRETFDQMRQNFPGAGGETPPMLDQIPPEWRARMQAMRSGGMGLRRPRRMMGGMGMRPEFLRRPRVPPTE